MATNIQIELLANQASALMKEHGIRAPEAARKVAGNKEMATQIISELGRRGGKQAAKARRKSKKKGATRAKKLAKPTTTEVLSYKGGTLSEEDLGRIPGALAYFEASRGS